MAAAGFLFSVIRYSHIGFKISIPVCGVFLLVLLTSFVSNNTSILQCVGSLCISYLLHVMHINIPYRFVHIENAILFIMGIIAMIVASLCYHWPWGSSFLESWFSFVIILIDEMMLIRYQTSRRGFRAIERPRDLTWAVDTSHAETIRLLTSEQEELFGRHLDSDFVTSAVAFAAFFSGQLVRFLLRPGFWGEIG
jgi:hypothetical protein